MPGAGPAPGENSTEHPMGELYQRISKFIRKDLWRVELDTLTFGKYLLVKGLRVIVLTMRSFKEDRCLLRAPSLTFFTLLSIVPVVAMLFGIAKGFGFEKLLEKELYRQFSGQEAIIVQLVDFANRVLETTRGGVIAGIGLLLLFWSVVKVLNNIERTLNDIWQVQAGRSWVRKFSDYLAIMLLSPVLMIMAGSATVFVKTQITEITQQVRLLGYLSPLISASFKLTPYLLVWLLFAIIYILMPNTRVQIKAGLLAAVVAGTFYQATQWVYLTFQIGVTRANAIYGSFAALPLFMIWVNISWIIVLLGAELSCAFQNADSYENESDSENISPRLRRLLTLQVAHLLGRNFASGRSPMTVAQMSRALNLPARLLKRIINQLIQSGLVAETCPAGEGDTAYQPARDINHMSLLEVIRAFEASGTDSLPAHDTPGKVALSEALAELAASLEQSPANRQLKDIGPDSN
jgi:membrane protein